MRIGRFDGVAPLRGKPDFYVWRAAGSSTDCCLIKVLPGPSVSTGAGAIDHELLLLRKLQSSQELQLPNLIDFGYDVDLHAHCYALHLPSPPILLSPELLRGVRHAAVMASIARALQILHEEGIAYRAFGFESYVCLGDQVMLYDIARAERMAIDRTVAPSPKRAPFDPPEATVGRYDGVRGDIYGLGWLMRAMITDEREKMILKAMTSDDPETRPNSMAEVFDILRRGGVG